MKNIKTFLVTEFKKAFIKKYQFNVDNQFFNVVYVGNHGIDYSMRSLFGLQKYLNTIGINTTCQELFDDLTYGLDKNHYDITFDRNCINISLKTIYICNLMQNIYNDNIISTTQNKQKILVDFSSPNIAKDMHVGHLRSTIIGDSICKLYELQGHEVHRINHIGDFGLQFGMIIQHLFEKYPNYQDCDFSIADLQNFYAESKKRFDTDENFKQIAYQRVVQLQTGDVVIVEAWNFIKEISRQSYNEIYNRLNITLTECGESFYQNKIPTLIEELELKNIIVVEDGRKIIKVDGYELPLTIVKSDGGFTYDTTDLAAVRYRLVDLDMNKIIYVVDNGQALHFELIFKIAEIVGWKRPDQELKHVGFGLVCGNDGKKFASRSGDTIKLKDLLSESIIKSGEMFEKLKLIKENALIKNNKPIPENNMSDDEKHNIIKTVAYSSIKYADLSTIRTNNYQFSHEKMLSLKGNTGVYQLYEYVRICAIIRNVSDCIDKIQNEIFNITEKEEHNVCKLILLFPVIIERISDDLMFHTLCSYLYELTNAFSVFHKKCRCLQFNEKKELINVNYNRISICIATQKILENCFCILGINKLEKM